MKHRLFVLIISLAFAFSFLSPVLFSSPFGAVASAATPSDSTLQKQGEASVACKKAANNDSGDIKYCAEFFVDGYHNPTKDASTFCLTAGDQGLCTAGFTAGQNVKKTADKQAATNQSSTTSTSNTDTSNIEKLSCDYTSSTISWLVCPMVDAMVKFIGAADNIITSQLSVNTNDIFCDNSSYSDAASNPKTCEDYYNAWKSFRNIALGLMLIAGLVILIAQALGLEILDAYTIRKTLPRLLIAAVAITLSWPLMQFGITLANDLGYGIRTLIYQPFSNLNNEIKFTFSGGAGAVFLAGGAVAAFGILGLLSYAATAALAVFVAILVLVIRQVAITVMVILAPVAIVCYILPNTQRVYKLWWESFSKALLMFPLIAAFIAAGRVFSAIALQGGTISQMVGFVAYFAPYFLIPLTFRMAGSFMAQVGGFVNDRGRGGFDRLSKFRGARAQQNIAHLGQGQRIKANNAAARAFNRTTRGIATIPAAGVTPWKMKSRYQAGMSTNKNNRIADYMEKSAAFKAIEKNDDYLQATMKSAGGGDTEDDWRRYLSSQNYEGRSLEQGIAKIRAAKRDSVSPDVFKAAAVKANASTGTGWKQTGAGGMLAAINEAAGDDRDLAIDMLAGMRGDAKQNGRPDLGGASFNKQLGWMQELHDNSKDPTTGIDQETATRNSVRRAWEVNSAGTWVGARGDSIRHLVPVLQDELRTAYQSGNEVTVDRTLAKIANLQDVLSYSSPEGAELLADGIFAQPIGAPRYERREEDEQVVDADGTTRIAPKGSYKLDTSGNRIPVLDANGNQESDPEINIRTEIEERQRRGSQNAPEFFNIRRDQQRFDEEQRRRGGGDFTPPTGTI